MIELVELDRRHEDFERRHATVYAVSLEGLDKGRLSQADFPHLRVLADPDQRMAEAFGVLHPHSGPGGGDTSAPTTIIVDGHGRVRWLYRPRRNIARLYPGDVLDALDRYLTPERAFGRARAGAPVSLFVPGAAR